MSRDLQKELDRLQRRYQRQHLRNIVSYAATIEQLYNELATQAALAGQGLSVPDAGLLDLAKFPAVNKRIDKLVRRLTAGISAVVVNGVNAEWGLANDSADEAVKLVSAGHKISDLTKGLWFDRRESALEEFRKRKINGLGLSERVWQLGEQAKSELELALDCGIRDGVAAIRLAPALKQYLKEPDRLYRRVRDTQDRLHLSRAASQYHPGQGVYRSSFANAKRLAGTETNIAYRTADYERMQRLDFVVGIKVELSNNHTTKGPKGLPVPLTDICDELQGKYPKDFKFTGWHPNCRCHAKSILLTPDELDEMLEAKARGKEYDAGVSSNYIGKSDALGIKKVNMWIEKNRERAKGWATMPYFVRENPHYVANFRVDTYSASERKFTRARHTSPAMTQSLTTYLQKKYPDIPNTEKAAICDYTRGDVSDFRHLNKELKNNSLSEFNAAFSELLSNALSKLPTVEATVYRTIRLNRTHLEYWKQQAKEQAETTFCGFTSTSDSLTAVLDMMRRKGARKKNNETDILLVIKGKTGHRIEDFSKFKDQHEMLFDKGMRLKFEGVSDINGHLTFDLTEL